MALGRGAEALACYDAALAARPAYAQALHNRGDLLRSQRQPEAALASYDASLALQPDNHAVLNNRGNTLLALRRFDAALASYDRALALRPGDPNVLNNRGGVLLAMKRYPEAARTFGELLARQPDAKYAAGSRFLRPTALLRPGANTIAPPRGLARRSPPAGPPTIPIHSCCIPPTPACSCAVAPAMRRANFPPRPNRSGAASAIVTTASALPTSPPNSRTMRQRS